MTAAGIRLSTDNRGWGYVPGSKKINFLNKGGGVDIIQSPKGDFLEKIR